MRWTELLDRFDRLSLRERGLVAAALLGLMLVIWDVAVQGPLQRKHRVREQAMVALRAEVQGLEQSAQTLAAQVQDDPVRAASQAVAALKAEIAGLDQRLTGATAGLIEPREMGRVLEDVLARTARLKLLSLRTLPAEPLVPVAPAAATAPAAQPAAAAGPQVWRHGVEIEVSGSYLDTLEFLQALEALPWRFYWDRVDFAVEQHPRGRARLLVHTLGLREGWIGV